MKHTAGPWIAKAMSRNGYLESARVIFDAAGNEICRIDYEAMPTGSEGIKKSDENGALLAAAPELLDALKELAPLLDGAKFDGYRQHVSCIIAKAEGK